MLKKVTALLFALVMVLSVAACDTDQQGEASDGTKTFYNWSSGNRTTFNPQMAVAAGDANSIDVYGSMVGIVSSVDGSDKLEFVPHHLERLPYSEDGGYTWICEFRTDAVWHNDGTPINANTYEYTMRMLLDPKLANKNTGYLFDPCRVVNAREYFQGNCQWEEVGVKVLDENTLQITLEYPSTEIDFWHSVGWRVCPVHEGMYEAGMNADRTSTTYGTTFESTPSGGPFHVKEWVSDGYELLAINPEDPLVKMGYFFLDEYHTRYIAQSQTRFQMFLNSEIDWAALSGDNYEPYKNDPRVHTTESASIFGMYINSTAETNPVLADKNLRQALLLSSPRVAIAKDVYVLYLPANFMIATPIVVTDENGEMVSYRDTAAAKAISETYDNNEELALELFNKAYEANGNNKITIEITYDSGQAPAKRSAEVCMEVWENLFGSDRFEVTLRAATASYVDLMYAGDFELCIHPYSNNVFNPWVSMVAFTSTQPNRFVTGFNDEEFDKLYYDCVYGELLNDPAGRLAALARMEEILMDSAVFIPNFQNNNSWVVQEWVKLPTQTFLPIISYGWRQADILPR